MSTSIHVAMIFLSGKPRIHAEQIQSCFESLTGKRLNSIDAELGVNLSFDWSGQILSVARMPAPFPSRDLDGPMESSALWPHASRELNAHRTHLVIRLTSRDLAPLHASRLLTEFTAAVLEACPDGLGVYWGNAPLLAPRNIFLQFAKEVLPHETPLLLWVDYRVGMRSGGKPFGFTSGLKALGLCEIGTKDATEEPEAIRERLLNLSGFLITNGMVLKPGTTIGEDESQRIILKKSKSEYGHDGEVLVLHYQALS